MVLTLVKQLEIAWTALSGSIADRAAICLYRVFLYV